MSSYYESAEGVKISKDRLSLELKKHGFLVGEVDRFLSENDISADKHGRYCAQSVLIGLGY